MKKPGRVFGEGEKESCERILRGQSAAELNESGSSHRTHLQGCNVYDTVSLVPSGVQGEGRPPSEMLPMWVKQQWYPFEDRSEHFFFQKQ